MTHQQTSHPRESAVLQAVPTQLLIGGKWRPATGERTYQVEDPATVTPLCSVADATPDDALDAVTAASQAQPQWAQHPPRERGEILRRAF